MFRTACTAVLVAAGAAVAQSPYTETFDSGAAGWTDGPGNPATDAGGYLSATVDLASFVPPPVGPGPSTAVLFRAEAADNASGGAFVGDYLAAGLNTITFDIRHDASGPLAFALRLATPANFPGATVVSPVLVDAGPGFTTLSFSLDPSNPFLTYEGFSGSVEDVLSNVGNIQILGALVDNGPATGNVTFEIDNVSIVPAPASAMLLGLGGLAAARRRR